MEISLLFYIFVGHFALLDPDPAQIMRIRNRKTCFTLVSYNYTGLHIGLESLRAEVLDQKVLNDL